MRSRGAPWRIGFSTCWRLAMPPPGRCPLLFFAICSFPFFSRLQNSIDDFLHDVGSILREITVAFTCEPQKLRGDLAIQIAGRDEHAELPSGVVKAVVSA